MKRTLFLIALCSLLFCGASAQKVELDQMSEELLKKTPQEKIYLHVNTTLLFPGEYLLYKVYNLNKEIGSPSEVSKLAYVELIGEEGNHVFKQKIALDTGTGQADFFVPTSVPSGNYKLVAYTNWMRNTGDFYQEDITIINPYRGRQAALKDAAPVESLAELQQLDISENAFLNLELPKKEFEPREKVVFQLNKKEKGLLDISISVRKKEEFGVKDPLSAKEFLKTIEEVAGMANDVVYLPELRGQLFQGEIVPTTSAQGNALRNKRVAISIPAEGLVPKVAITNESGIFYFDVDKSASAGEAALEVLGKDRDLYEVRLLSEPAIDPAAFHFTEFELSAAMEEEILRRSVHNQIENSYFAVKPDTVVTVEDKKQFYSNISETYDLDDYTRFKTVPETFVEIINSAWIRKNAEGKSVLAVRGLSDNIDMNLLPLVSVDGVLLQDHEDLIFFNPQEIQNISLIRDKIYVGAEIFQGAVLVETVDGDFFETYSKPFTTKVELSQPEVEKKYFQQNYKKDSDLSRIPDYRYQLLWEPNYRLQNESSQVVFFTSDVPGEYEIVVEGFSKRGVPISLREKFKVKQK